MKINFSETIKNLKDETIRRQTENADGTRGVDEDMTLAWVCIQGLLAPRRDLTDEKEKLVRGHLAMKIFPEGEIDLTIDEIVKIKRLVGETQPVWWVTRVAELLEKSVESLEEETND